MPGLKGQITEIFSSIQGEGIFVGAKQIFVRFDKCNLSCAFCDERDRPDPEEYGPDKLMQEIKALEESKGPHHSVSFTGGEPLLYCDFLKVFLRMMRKVRGFRSYLETNGTLPDELSRVIDLVDIVAMDFKLPSSTGAGSFWAEHAEFLKIASKKKVFVKAVVTAGTTREDIERAMELIKRQRKIIPFILQPASTISAADKAIDRDSLFKLLEAGLKSGVENIRVIPQVHKMMRVK